MLSRVTEDDTEAIKAIKEAKGNDYSQDYNRQGQAWDPFAKDMWTAYRNNLPPARH